MINWKRYSFDQIRRKWELFIKTRKKYLHGVPKKYSNTQITCLEREALIKELLDRLQLADSCIESSEIFKESLK